jgi:hypothetical protein
MMVAYYVRKMSGDKRFSFGDRMKLFICGYADLRKFSDNSVGAVMVEKNVLTNEIVSIKGFLMVNNKDFEIDAYYHMDEGDALLSRRDFVYEYRRNPDFRERVTLVSVGIRKKVRLDIREAEMQFRVMSLRDERQAEVAGQKSISRKVGEERAWVGSAGVTNKTFNERLRQSGEYGKYSGAGGPQLAVDYGAKLKKLGYGQKSRG